MSWQRIAPCPRCQSDVMFTCDGPGCDSHVTHGLPPWWRSGPLAPAGPIGDGGTLFCSVLCEERAAAASTAA